MENKFTVTIESSNGMKHVVTLPNLVQASDAALLLFHSDYYYGKSDSFKLSKRAEQYKTDYGVSVFSINKEADDRLNKQMYGE